MGQQLPFGEWELFHLSPIFTLITILFKIASANLYKCLTKPNQNQQRGRRTSYTSTSNEIRKANFNHSFYINIEARDSVSLGTVLLVTTVEASDSRNALAKSRKTPYANIGNRLLEGHSIQQEIRPIKNNAKHAKILKRKKASTIQEETSTITLESDILG